MTTKKAIRTEPHLERQLTTKEAAALTGLSVAFFERARWAGGGPPFRRLGSGKGRAVRYPQSELLKWIDAHPLVKSTSDLGRA